MIYINAIILGLIQGITEFLPVSSSGHFVLMERLGFTLGEESVFFNLSMHIGTLFAVFVVFKSKIAEIVKNPFSPLTKKLLIATIPTVIIAFFIKYFFKEILNGKYLSIGFIITTVLLVLGEVFKKEDNPLTSKKAFITGIVQGLAVLPGISRSGSTVSCMNLLNVDKKESADFTFLLSIPVILGGFILELMDINFSSINWLAVILGMATSFLSGVFAIKVFLKIFKNAKLKYFAIYTFILSIITLFI